jgi:folate-dependent phosphoribosylglycinamide formyltransferase PurN
LKIAILTRFPRADAAIWKVDLARQLLDAGADLVILYTRSARVDHLRAGLKEFGTGTWSQYRRLRHLDTEASPLGQSLSQWAEDRAVPVHRFRSISEPFCEDLLRKHRVDLLILAGADIVPNSILEIPRQGAINAHFGLLPAYRGMNVAEWSIYHDDPVAVSAHFVDRGIDTGDIISRELVPVELGDTLATIRVKQRRLATALLVDAVDKIFASLVTRTRQHAAEGRQFYRMHPLLKERVERKLATGRYRWLGDMSDTREVDTYRLRARDA